MQFNFLTPNIVKMEQSFKIGIFTIADPDTYAQNLIFNSVPMN
jgi:hypothetical protein